MSGRRYRNRPGFGHERDVRFVSLLVEVDLAIASGITDETELAKVLASLCWAGLHGLVLDVARVELNGTRQLAAEDPEYLPSDVKRLRPPPDARLLAAARALRALSREVDKALGVDEPEGGEESATASP